MIEKCTKKRMLISIVLLIGLSIAIVLLEHHLTPGTHHSSHLAGLPANLTAAGQCWLTETFTVVEQCSPCSEFEKKSKIPSCESTGYKEKIHCATLGDATRSCERVLWLEERRFWTLEIISLALGLASSTFVLWRQKILERQAMKKIQQNINMTL